MKIMGVEPISFNAGVRIMDSENTGHKYLYNEVLNMTREMKIPATFYSTKIELPSITKSVLARLNELGIKFNNK